MTDFKTSRGPLDEKSRDIGYFILGGLAIAITAIALTDDKSSSRDRKVAKITLEDESQRKIAINGISGEVQGVQEVIDEKRQEILNPSTFTVIPGNSPVRFKPTGIIKPSLPKAENTRLLEQIKVISPERKYPDAYYDLSSKSQWKFRKCLQGEPKYAGRC